MNTPEPNLPFSDSELRPRRRMSDPPNPINSPGFNVTFDRVSERVNAHQVAQEQQHKPHDPVSPSHYQREGMQCIDVIEAATANLRGIDAACTANALKYLWRWKDKNGVEDLKKARWYLDHLIELNK